MIRMIVEDGWVSSPHPSAPGLFCRTPVMEPELQVAVERAARHFVRYLRIIASIEARRRAVG